MEFVRGVIRISKRYRVLHYDRYLHGEPIDDDGTRSVVWFRPDGREMDPPSWSDPNARVVGLLLSDRTTRLLILVSAYHLPLQLQAADAPMSRGWTVRIDSGTGEIDPPDRRFAAGNAFELAGRTLLLLRRGAGVTGTAMRVDSAQRRRHGFRKAEPE